MEPKRGPALVSEAPWKDLVRAGDPEKVGRGVPPFPAQLEGVGRRVCNLVPASMGSRR